VPVRDVLRQAWLPSPDDTWPTGARVRWLYLGRVVALPITILTNLLLWLGLRGDPAVRPDTANLFLLINESLLAVDLVVTLVFLRHTARPRPWVLIAGGCAEILATVVWIQMTGTLTSYFLGTIAVLAMLYRILGNYWCGLACLLTGAIGITVSYALEEAGVLPRSSLFVHDVTAAVLPDVFRRTAVISLSTVMLICFVAMNLLARSLERSRAALEEVRAELAAVVDEARLGRLSGLRLGHYQLGELLGRGGMGEVYEARDAGGAQVACKVLHAHLGADTTARARFRREAELIQRLPGDCAARVLAVGTGPGGAEYIAMERLHGDDLGAFLRRRGRLSLEDTLVLTRAIADALTEAHAAGIVHRDLKPSNVFLLDERIDQVRLLDFGIARLYEAATSATLTETTAVLGSPGYMPPEQAAADHAAIGPATDVFALGAIVYRALTGQPAFPSRNPAAAIFEALHHVPSAPGVHAPLPRGVDRAIGVALAKDWRQRYRSPRELATDLERAAGGDPLDDVAARATGVARQRSAPITMTESPYPSD
jgi:hypothetical protein